jgi:hypothetical protein
MGFFDFMRKGKNEEEAKAPQLTEAGEAAIDGVMDAVGKHLSARMEAERNEAEELYDRIKFNLVHIRKLAGELERKKFESGEKLYAPVNMTKDNYVKKAASLLGSVPNVETFDYEEMAGFCRETGKTLHELMNIPPKQAILLTKYFKGESSKIVMKLKETEDARKRLDSLLSGSTLKIAGEIGAKAETLSELLEKEKDYGRHEFALREKAKDKRKEMEVAEKDRDAFSSGEEAADFKEAEEAIAKMESEKDAISNKINEELSPIKRPVKKLEHSLTGGEAMDKEKLALYSRISHSPSKVLFQEQGDSLIMGALVRLRGLHLKDNERSHVEELIKKIELGYLPKLADRFKWLESEVASKKAALEKSGVPEKHKRMGREIENLQREIAGLEAEAEKFSSGKAEVSGKIADEKAKLEEKILKEAGVRLSIILGG